MKNGYEQNEKIDPELSEKLKKLAAEGYSAEEIQNAKMIYLESVRCASKNNSMF